MRLVFLGIITASFLSTFSSANDDYGQSDMLDKLLDLKIVRSAEISPDGEHIAYLTFENDFEADKDMSQLWLISKNGGTPLQLTNSENPVGEYEWSTDSQWLAFVRDSKLHFINIAGGEALTPEFDIKSFSNLRFAPDGGALYFLSGPEDKSVIEAREKRYGKYDVVREDGNYQHIWRAKLTPDMKLDGKPEQLTSGRDFNVTGYALSHNGQNIAFATWPSPHLATLLNGKLYVMPHNEAKPRLLDDTYGGKSTPIWHTNNRQIAYTNATSFAGYSDIVIRDIGSDAGRTIPMPNHDPNLVWFEGDTLSFTAGVGTNIGLYKKDISNETITQVSDPNVFTRGYSYAADGKSYAFLSSTHTSLSEVSIAGKDGPAVLTAYSDQLGTDPLPTKELIKWTSDDGLEIEGVLTKPANYKAGKRYPLYVRTHGGPTGTDRPWLVGAPRSIYQPEVLASEGDGALVLQTNYRGSASYGDNFQRSNLKNLGIGPARDIIAGVNMLIENGLVDPDRIACLGWSQGGHISAMLATYSDICTAAIMGAGISDWRTYYYNTDITQFTTEYFGATPLDDDAVYARTSPVTYIENAKTPVLIQHGENDQRVPIANGYQFRQLLLDKGIDARMIVYANMQHGPSKPRTRRAISEHALAWLREQLFGKDTVNFVSPDVPSADTDNN